MELVPSEIFCITKNRFFMSCHLWKNFVGLGFHVSRIRRTLLDWTNQADLMNFSKLIAHECHGADDQKGEIRLDNLGLDFLRIRQRSNFGKWF